MLLRGGNLIDGTAGLRSAAGGLGDRGDSGGPTGRSGARPTVGTADFGAWRSNPRHQMMIVADAAVVTGDDPGGRREIIGGAAIPTSVLDRLACNSELFGLVFSGDGQPLWHGRGVRMVTDAQLRGLMVRDQGCVICDKSPRWCEAHHVIAWQGPGRGPTDIDNLVLICSHHHHLVHDHRWRLVRSSTGHWRVEPPDIGPPPAGRDP